MHARTSSHVNLLQEDATPTRRSRCCSYSSYPTPRCANIARLYGSDIRMQRQKQGLPTAYDCNVLAMHRFRFLRFRFPASAS